MQVVAVAADGDFRDQFRRAADVFAIVTRLAAKLRDYTEIDVRLRLVVPIEADGSVVATLDAGRGDAICAQPCYQIKMRATMFSGNGRWHIDLSLNKLRLLDIGHGRIAPLELGRASSDLPRKAAEPLRLASKLPDSEYLSQRLPWESPRWNPRPSQNKYTIRPVANQYVPSYRAPAVPCSDGAAGSTVSAKVERRIDLTA